MIPRLFVCLLGVGSFISKVQAYSPKPDLIAAGVIAALKTDTNSSPLYAESYNLGPTGLRGWMYRDPANMGQEGLQTNQDRQILITAVGAGTPASSAGLAVDDVILGVKAGSGTALAYPADAFTTDARKAFGAAITEAETTAKAGVFRILRWRAGVFSEVQLNLPAIGDYTATAPYNCPKSAAVLAAAIARLDSETANSMSGGWSDAAKALALLAAVKPADANYNAVRQKLQNYARNIAPANLSLSGCDTWNWGYMNIFLSEYYLRTIAGSISGSMAIFPATNAFFPNTIPRFATSPAEFTGPYQEIEPCRLPSACRSAPPWPKVPYMPWPLAVEMVISRMACMTSLSPVRR